VLGIAIRTLTDSPRPKRGPFDQALWLNRRELAHLVGAIAAVMRRRDCESKLSRRRAKHIFRLYGARGSWHATLRRARAVLRSAVQMSAIGDNG